MKRKTVYITVIAIISIAVACVAWLCAAFPATLRNVYEDSWWIDTPHRSTYTAWPTWDADMECIYRMEQMAERREWRELLPYARRLMHENRESADKERPGLAVLAMRYAMLAESCLGSLPYNIAQYPVRSPEDFVFFRYREREACLFNAFFFRELGLPDEVFHQAMEYPLAFAHCTHRAMRLMTESAVKSGDMAVAHKLMHVGSRLSPLSDEQQSMCREGDSKQPSDVLRSNIFIFGDPMLTVFVRMLDADKGNRRLVDYAALSFIMMGHRDKCQQVLRLCPVYDGQPLPPVYQ